MIDIKDEVRVILQHRREHLRPVETALSKVDGLLNELKLFQDAAAEESGFLPTEAAEGIKIFPAEAAIKSAQNARQDLERAAQRLRRDCVNIGVAGCARQGKSTFLKTFSGFEKDDAIPTGGKGFCTAVRSEIRNSTAHSARVLLHTRDSFLNETILPYYKQLNLSPVPGNLDEFMFRELPPLANVGDVFLRSNLYKVLQDVRANLGKVMGMMLGSEKEIAAGEIRDYVAKDGESWKYLAVRKAVIDVPFPDKSLPLELRLIDLPGLGDLALNIKQELMKSVADLADIVLIVRMPSATGDEFGVQDMETFKLVREALPDLEPDRWMAMILNHTTTKDHDNTDIAKTMLEEMAPKFDFGGIKIWLCDCSNVEEVRTRVVGPAMDLLKLYTGALDRKRLDAARKSLEELKALLANPINDLTVTLASHGSDFRDNIAEKYSEDFLTDLRANLRRLLNDLRPGATKDWDEPAGNIVKAIRQMTTDVHAANAKDGDPPAGYRPWNAAIISKKLKNLAGGFDGVRNESATNTRVALTRFISSRLETFFQNYCAKLKSRIAEKIKATNPMAKLIAVADDQGKDSGLGVMADALAGQAPILSNAFRRFSQLSFTYDADFHTIVRDYLRPLDPDDTDVFNGPDGLGKVHSYNEKPIEFDADAKYIREVLDVTSERILDRLSEAPMDLKDHMKKAVFAAAEELCDQIIWSDEAEREWRLVLHNRRRELWADQYADQDARDKAIREWRRRLDDIGRIASELAAATLRPESGQYSQTKGGQFHG
ncbi:MAG: hypothetical protein LBU23_10490 [Planctomycetota bacterium]|nr:hypothetical protein [Planctomycetota bacterium]